MHAIGLVYISGEGNAQWDISAVTVTFTCVLHSELCVVCFGKRRHQGHFSCEC